MTEMFPILPLNEGQALSIALTSYDGGVFFGVNADRDAMPDVAAVAAWLGTSLGDLVVVSTPADIEPGTRAGALAAGEPHVSAAAPRRGLVLGSGGVLGFAWLLGALSALEAEAGFDAREVEVVVGTSAGSVAAALLGCGLPVDVISRHHQGIPAPGDPVADLRLPAGVGDAMPPRPGWRPASPRLAWDGLRHPRRISPIVALTGLLPPGGARWHRCTRSSRAWPRRPVSPIGGRSAAAVDRRRRPASPAGGWSSDGTTSAPGPDGVRAASSVARGWPMPCRPPARFRRWYPPTVIDGVPYVDGGAVSIASVDVLRHTSVDEVFVLAPMASVDLDHPRTTAGEAGAAAAPVGHPPDRGRCRRSCARSGCGSACSRQDRPTWPRWA